MGRIVALAESDQHRFLLMGNLFQPFLFPLWSGGRNKKIFSFTQESTNCFIE